MTTETAPLPVDQEQYQLGLEMAHGVVTTLYEQADYRATHDTLTGALNLSGLQKELSSIDAVGTPVAMLFVDGDNIKKINDVLGHDAGDRAIIGTADTLRSCLRPADVIARVGGDEFVVILKGNPRLDKSDEPEVLYSKVLSLPKLVDTTKSRLAKCVKKFQEMNPDLNAQGFDLSVGAAIRKSGDTFEETKAIAEANMYQHKERDSGPMTAEKKAALENLAAMAVKRGISPRELTIFLRTYQT